MKFKTALGIAFGLCLFPYTVLTSCSSDAEEPLMPEVVETTEQPTDGRKLCQLTISEVPFTRATLTDNTNTLGAAWNKNDAATYFNLSSYSSTTMDYGALIASSDAVTSTFIGTVRCKADDKLALFYPATAPITSAGDNRGKFLINLAGQKGTLEDIAKNFHYTYGVGTVTSVTDGTASATISSMKSLLAVCKFTFNDGSNTIPVKRLSIGYADATYEYFETGYPPTGTVNPFKKVDDVTTIVPLEEICVTAASPSDDALVFDFGVQTSDVVYAALFPVSNQLFHFTVTNDEGTYTGTATATLKAGKYYPVNLKLTKTN